MHLKSSLFRRVSRVAVLQSALTDKPIVETSSRKRRSPPWTASPAAFCPPGPASGCCWRSCAADWRAPPFPSQGWLPSRHRGWRYTAPKHTQTESWRDAPDDAGGRDRSGLVAHLRLDQVVSLSSYVFEETQHIDWAFILQLLQHAVNHNVRSCPAHAGTEETHRWHVKQLVYCRLHPWNQPVEAFARMCVFTCSVRAWGPSLESVRRRTSWRRWAQVACIQGRPYPATECSDTAAPSSRSDGP